MIENERAISKTSSSLSTKNSDDEAPTGTKAESASIAAIKLAEKLRVVDEATSFPPIIKKSKQSEQASSRVLHDYS